MSTELIDYPDGELLHSLVKTKVVQAGKESVWIDITAYDAV